MDSSSLPDTDVKFEGKVASVVTTIVTLRGGAEVRTFQAGAQSARRSRSKENSTAPSSRK